MTGVIMMFSLFCLFVLEMYLKAKIGGHSHGGPTGGEFTGEHQATIVHMHQHQPKIVHGPADLMRNNTSGSLPPYQAGQNQAYADAYEEKLFAR
jgi:hypothetical protein